MQGNLRGVFGAVAAGVPKRRSSQGGISGGICGAFRIIAKASARHLSIHLDVIVRILVSRWLKTGGMSGAIVLPNELHVRV